MYADTSFACVSIMGRAVNEPPPFTKLLMLGGSHFILASDLIVVMIFAGSFQ